MRLLDSLHCKLRRGDFVLVNDPPFKKPVAAEVIACGNYGSLCIKFADGRRRYFSSRDSYADILAAARRNGDGYEPLDYDQ
jgi:hypothetical protein